MLKDYSNDELSFVIIPDFLADGAFNQAVDGVKYIIHIASPLATGAPPDADAESYFIQPAVRGTLSVLEAAHRRGGISRIVITSSIAALFPAGYSDEPARFANHVVSPQYRKTYPEGPFDTTMAKYGASKLAALLRAEKFVNNSPSFDIIHIHPSYIFGRDDLVETVADFQTGTNHLILDLALGTPRTNTFMWAWNHVDDAARIHVEALKPEVNGNQSFIVATNEPSRSWDDTHAIVERNFPEAVQDGRLPNNATYKTLFPKFDTSTTTDAFGPLKGFEEAVVGVVSHYLEIV